MSSPRSLARVPLFVCAHTTVGNKTIFNSRCCCSIYPFIFVEISCDVATKKQVFFFLFCREAAEYNLGDPVSSILDAGSHVSLEK
jgi:hypothetical protein